MLDILNTDGTLNLQRWSSLCANAAREAAASCSGVESVFRRTFTRLIAACIAQLPADLHAQAIELASEHGDFSADTSGAEELSTTPSSPSAEAAAAEARAREAVLARQTQEFETELFFMLDAHPAKLNGAADDAAQNAAMTRGLVSGMMRNWQKNGLLVRARILPKPEASSRITLAIVAAMPRRLFVSDAQLEITLGPDGASYSSNLILAGSHSPRMHPAAQPDYNFWLMAVLQAFGSAAIALQKNGRPVPLADSPAWARIDAVMRGDNHSPRA